MYQYTEADSKHIQQMFEQREEEDRLRRILAEREKEASVHWQRKTALKSFIHSEKDKTPVNHAFITAAELALFANHLTKYYPVVKAFNMHVPEFYLQPLPDAIIFFDARGEEYETVELGRTTTSFGAEVYDYLSKRDLKDIKAYANRTLKIETLNGWAPGSSG